MTTIRLRRGTAGQWRNKNPVLDPGEPGFETDTGKLKIGDGSTSWGSLPYFIREDQIAAETADASSRIGSTIAAAYAPIINVATQYASMMSTPAAAINQAIMDANAAYQSTNVVHTLLLDQRVWTLETYIAPLNGVRVVGSGMFGTVLETPGNVSAFQFIGSSTDYLTDFHISDLSIDASAQAGGYIDTMKCIFIQYADYCSFQRLYLHDSYATVFGCDWPSHVTVEDCYFVNGGRGTSLAIGDGGNGLGCLIGDGAGSSTAKEWLIRVSRCTALNCEDIGFLIEAGSAPPANIVEGVVFTDCYAAQCGIAGFMDAGSYGAVFQGCNAVSNTGDGFAVSHGDKPDGAAFVPGGHGVFSACLAIRNSGHGFRYDLSVTAPAFSGYTLIGCNALDNDLAGIAILLSSVANADRIMILGCNITGNNGGVTNSYAGIFLSTSGASGATNLKISDNIVADNTGTGILLGANVTGGEIDSYVNTGTGGPQTTALAIAVGTTMTKVKFGGSYYATTPVNIAGTLAPSCSVETPTPGWTRKTGAPVVSAPPGTIYQREDGSTGNHLYVNTDGSAGWTPFA